MSEAVAVVCEPFIALDSTQNVFVTEFTYTHTHTHTLDSAGLAQCCRCLLPLQAWAGAYCVSFSHSSFHCLMMCVCCPLALRVTLHTPIGTILPICAESAVKHQLTQ